MEGILDVAYERAEEVLMECISPLGFKASALDGGYHQVWARDSVITFLGAMLIGNPGIQEACRTSLNTLRKYQTEIGLVPSKVDIRSGRANYQSYADSGLWYVIGHAVFFDNTGDVNYLKQSYPSIQSTLTWYQYQDVDQTNLITMEKAADWQDRFVVRGKGLYVNALYCLALKKASALARHLGDEGQAEEYRERAGRVAATINKFFWYKGDGDLAGCMEYCFEFPEEDRDEMKQILQGIRTPDSCYYLHYLTFWDVGTRFDSLGNLMTIISGVADKRRANIILDCIKDYGLADIYPIQSIYPAIYRGEKDWEDHYTLGKLNLPHQYHNGGIWPFIGGFYVAALVKMGRIDEAQNALRLLAKANHAGKTFEWEFNEWLHGLSGQPMGKEKQAWSAAMYIYAYETSKQKQLLLFA